jgi:uncharacterized membrane protein YraQ (UPF0718 family)
MGLVSKKIEGKWIFLAAVVFLYFLLAFFDFSLIKDSVLFFFSLVLKILPVFLTVFFLMFLMRIFIGPKRIIKYLGEGTGLGGWLIAIGGGILSSGPIYMWYPLLADMQAEGMKKSLIAAFMYNRAVKLPLLPLMVYYFGLPFTVILTFYMIVFSVISGVLIGRFVK